MKNNTILRKSLRFFITILVAAYFIAPMIAGIWEIGDCWGPKIYPVSLHQYLYTLSWKMSSASESGPRIEPYWKREYRPWFYGMYSINHDRDYASDMNLYQFTKYEKRNMYDIRNILPARNMMLLRFSALPLCANMARRNGATGIIFGMCVKQKKYGLSKANLMNRDWISFSMMPGQRQAPVFVWEKARSLMRKAWCSCSTSRLT